MKQLLLIIAVFFVSRRLNAEEFVRYQIIIDKSPFGSVSAAGAAEVVKDWAQKYQLVALVVSNAGQGAVQAGIFDKEANRSYYRAEGEALENGIKILKIVQDQKQVKVTIQSGLDTAQLTFAQRSASPMMASAGPAPQANSIPQPGAQPNGAPAAVRRIPFRRGN